MSIDFKSLDEFPTFTGEESPQEQIRQLQNYLFSMKESIRYLLSNLGEDNMNPTAWKLMKTSTLDEQTQEMVFNKLTNNGEVQGFFVKNNQLYINAEFVRVLNLIAEKLRTSSGGYTIRIQDGKITAVHDDETAVSLVKIECSDYDFGAVGSYDKGYVGSMEIQALITMKDGTQIKKGLIMTPEAIGFEDESGETELSIPHSARWEYVESIGKEVLTREVVNV